MRAARAFFYWIFNNKNDNLERCLLCALVVVYVVIIIIISLLLSLAEARRKQQEELPDVTILTVGIGGVEQYRTFMQPYQHLLGSRGLDRRVRVDGVDGNASIFMAIPILSCWH